MISRWQVNRFGRGKPPVVALVLGHKRGVTGARLLPAFSQSEMHPYFGDFGVRSWVLGFKRVSFGDFGVGSWDFVGNPSLRQRSVRVT